MLGVKGATVSSTRVLELQFEFIIKSFFDWLGQGTREADHTHAPEQEEEEKMGNSCVDDWTKASARNGQ